MLKNYLNQVFLKLSSSKKYFIAFGAALAILSILKLFSYSWSNNPSDASFEDYFNTNYKIFSVRIPQNINFAGELVPISDFRTHAAMERELVKNTYWESHSLELHIRAKQWFPIIEPILLKHNIPNDFKYVALVESQLTNVVSPQGATGFWQIIESTGKGYGLEINDEVDERYHVVKSTETACKYFNEAYKQFNNWTLVAASYNLGMGGIQAKLNKQKVDNYYDMHLTPETAQYLYRILTMKEIISRPKVYGFMLRKKDVYHSIPTKFITVDSSISDLSAFANSQGINYSILKTFNPWLRANTLTNDPDKDSLLLINKNKGRRKIYILAIPKNPVTTEDLVVISDEILKLTDSIALTSPSVLMNDTIKAGKPPIK